MILANLVKDPLYTLSYMFGDPHKWPTWRRCWRRFAFLSLLAPGRLLLGLPVLGLNLIAWRGVADRLPHPLPVADHHRRRRRGHRGLRRAGAADRRAGGRLDPVAEVTPAGMEARPAPTAADVAAATRNLLLWRDGPLLAVLVVALVVNMRAASTR